MPCRFHDAHEGENRAWYTGCSRMGGPSEPRAGETTMRRATRAATCLTALVLGLALASPTFAQQATPTAAASPVAAATAPPAAATPATGGAATPAPTPAP